MSTLEGLRRAYQSGRSDPVRALEGVLAAAREAASRRPSHAVFCALDEAGARAAAEASAARWARGEARGPWDGIPTAVKDEVDVQGLPTRSGTVYLPTEPVAEDATAVARLRQAGAVVVGKLVQHELGLGATGISPHGTRTPRNPHQPGHCPGGSSSGGAVAVALGLVPMTLSSDGGGSVRIPASSCGVFGLKPTFGRVPNTGDTNLDGTVGHLGPIASTVDAMEAFLRTTAGPDGRCRLAARAPALDLDALTKSRTAGAAGLRVAVDEDAWADADPAVAAPCREALRALERAGATLHTASVPLGVHAPALGFITMISEAAEGHAEEYDRHRDVMALDVRMALALGRRMRAREYHHAQRLRQRLRAELAQVFARADLYVTPTTGCTAPPVRPGAEDTGEVDQFTTNKLVRYTFLGNLTGLPAGTAPVGRDAYGLPVGMQLMARAWDEPMVLRGLYALEALGAARVERPEVYFELDP